jgi:glycosyltransferase involved in cell wall biosynthesis
MWGFATGCVPFLISNAKCWFSEFLKPFVNYIPIKYDLSDLIEKIEWVRNNDELAEKISKNALEFTDDIFSASFQQSYLKVSINNILKLD